MTGTTMRPLLAAMTLGCALLAGPAFGQVWPNQPVKIVVPFAAGGGGDSLGRILADKLREPLGQPVIVENKPGASTIIGSEQVAKATPDGYTVLLNVPNIVMTKFMTDKLPYDPLTDFIPVVEIVKAQSWLAVSTAKVKSTNLKDFVAEVKAKPKEHFYGSIGPGSVGHLLGFAFNEAAQLGIEHVPYKGGAPAATALAAGEISAAFLDLIILKPQVDAGRVRLLAVSGTKRSTNYPDVPNFSEAGYSGFDVYSWAGLFAPAKTPQPVVARLAAEVRKVLADPEVIAKFQAIGYDPGTVALGDFAAMVKADHDRWGALIKKANVKIN